MIRFVRLLCCRHSHDRLTKGWTVRQALQGTVQEASVAKVVESFRGSITTNVVALPSIGFQHFPFIAKSSPRQVQFSIRGIGSRPQANLVTCSLFYRHTRQVGRSMRVFAAFDKSSRDVYFVMLPKRDDAICGIWHSTDWKSVCYIFWRNLWPMLSLLRVHWLPV